MDVPDVGAKRLAAFAADPAFPAMLRIICRLRAAGWTTERSINWLTCALEHLGAEGFRAWLASDPELPFVRSDDPGGWHAQRAEHAARFREQLRQGKRERLRYRRPHAPAGALRSAPRPVARPREHRAATRRQASRGGPARPDDPPLHPVDLTRLQAALLPFVCAMELAAELDEREFDAFLSIAAIRIARDASRLRWWEAA
jgi:hypothetical protein